MNKNDITCLSLILKYKDQQKIFLSKDQQLVNHLTEIY